MSATVPQQPADAPAHDRPSGPSAAEVAAQARARRAAKEATTPEAIEAALVARRAALNADLSALGARLAPEALKAQAKSSARQAVAQARAGIVSSVSTRLRDAAGAVGVSGSRASTGAPSPDASAPCASSPRLTDRLNRLLDDARDGDPAALGIVTGAAVLLVGVSVFATVKALRR